MLDDPLLAPLAILFYLAFILLPCYLTWLLLRALILWTPPETSYCRLGIMTRDQERRMWVVRQRELQAEGERRRQAAAGAASKQVTR